MLYCCVGVINLNFFPLHAATLLLLLHTVHTARTLTAAQETADRRACSRLGRERAGRDCATPSTASERLGLQQPNSSSSSSSSSSCSSFPDVGSGGSRLLAGNSMYAEELESWIARFHRRQAALLFNSGYDANLGLMSCLPQRGDAVVCDELVHNSMMVSLRCRYTRRG